MKNFILHLFVISAILCSSNFLSAQTTINLADQCNCEVLSSDTTMAVGATAPTGAAEGNIIVDPIGNILYWDGDSWEATMSPADTTQTDYSQYVTNPDIYEANPINTPLETDTTAIWADTLMTNIDTTVNITDGKDHDWYVQNRGAKTYNQAYSIYRGLWTYGSLSWGDRSTVASGWLASAAGRGNLAQGHYSFALGGAFNSVLGHGSVATGYKNDIRAHWSFVGGRENKVGTSGHYGMVTGYGNNVNNQRNVVGGYFNTVSGYDNVIGGQNNVVSSHNNLVVGVRDTVTTVQNIVGGGENKVSNYQNIVGGAQNKISGTRNLVGGANNIVSSNENMVVGNSNDVSNVYNIVGGSGNTVSQNRNIVGGIGNTVTSTQNMVVGQANDVSNAYNVVGGTGNTVTQNRNIVGGYNNVVSQIANLVVGHTNTVAGAQGIVAGTGNNVTAGGNSLAIGANNNVNYSHCYALGVNNTLGAGHSSAVNMSFGRNNTVYSGSFACAIGSGNSAEYSGSMALGTSATTTVNNQLRAVFTGGISFNTAVTVSSDRRLKKNITDSKYGLAEILAMQPKTYEYKKSDGKTVNVGFIAQEMLEVVPEIVDTNGEYLGIRYEEVIPVLTKAIQEQQAQIEALQQQNTALSAKANELDALKAEIASIKTMLEGQATKADMPQSVSEKE